MNLHFEEFSCRGFHKGTGVPFGRFRGSGDSKPPKLLLLLVTKEEKKS